MTGSGRVFVRYLPQGVSAGDPRAGFVTVGTYPDASAYANLERAARRHAPSTSTARPASCSVALDRYGRSGPSFMCCNLQKGIAFTLPVSGSRTQNLPPQTV